MKATNNKNPKKRRSILYFALVMLVAIAVPLGISIGGNTAQSPEEDVGTVQAVLFERNVYIGEMDRWDISDEDLALVMSAVSCTAKGEREVVQQAVAQCIRATCEDYDMPIADVLRTYGWPVDMSVEPSPTTITAVYKVVTGHPAIAATVHFCYNPELQQSVWHESQIFVCQIGHLRFFESRDIPCED